MSGYIKDRTASPDNRAFPGATYEIAGEVPLPQCTSAIYEGFEGVSSGGPPSLVDVGAMPPFDKVGLYITMIDKVSGFPRTEIILVSAEFGVSFAPPPPGAHADVHWFLHNGGTVEETRDVQSFVEFIKAAGYSYTFKSGRLYTNMPTIEMPEACLILFDPLT